MADQLHVELDPDRLRAEPGARADTTVRVVNLADVVEEYELEVVGLPPGIGRVEPAQLSLLPEQEGQARVVLDLAAGPTIPAGTRVAGVRVASRNRPANAYVAELSLDVVAVDDLALQVAPQTVRAGGSGQLRAQVHNQGNRPADVALRGNDDEGAVSFTFEPQRLRVPPGGRAESQVTLRAPRSWTGAARHRQVSIGAGDAEAHAIFVQKPRVPVGVLTALGVLLSLLVVGVVAVCASGGCFGGDGEVDPVAVATSPSQETSAPTTEDETEEPSSEPSAPAVTTPSPGGDDSTAGETGPTLGDPPLLEIPIGSFPVLELCIPGFVPCELSVIDAASDGGEVGPGGGAGYGRAVAAVDLDGDDVDEMAIGVPGATVDGQAAAGYVVVLDATTGGVQDGSTVVVRLADVTGAPTATANDGFGSSLATGDFDGDGNEDLAVGAPGVDTAGTFAVGGAAVLYGGSGVAPRASQWVEVNDESGGRAGAALAGGDFDGRGGDDLAVGVPLETAASGFPAAGAVHVVSFRSDGVPGVTRRVTQLDLPGVRAEPGDGFGSALAAGDLFGDGLDDLVIGVPGESNGGTRSAGLVHVLGGREGQGPDRGSPIFVGQGRGAVPGNVEPDRFGTSVAVGDVTGHGLDDLLVGAPGESLGGGPPDAGGVWLVPGNPTTLDTGNVQVLDQDRAGISGGGAGGDLFGTSVAVGDIDGDGVADVLVSAPGEDVDGVSAAGVVNGFRGGSGDLVDNDPFELRPGQGLAGEVTANAALGTGLAVGDLDGDDAVELAAGAPGVLVDGLDGAGSVLIAYSVGSE